MCVSVCECRVIYSSFVCFNIPYNSVEEIKSKNLMDAPPHNTVNASGPNVEAATKIMSFFCFVLKVCLIH